MLFLKYVSHVLYNEDVIKFYSTENLTWKLQNVKDGVQN